MTTAAFDPLAAYALSVLRSDAGWVALYMRSLCSRRHLPRNRFSDDDLLTTEARADERRQEAHGGGERVLCLCRWCTLSTSTWTPMTRLRVCTA